MAHNIELMKKIRDQVTNNPESHGQDTWGFKDECDTTYCIAGWAAALSGARLMWNRGKLIDVETGNGESVHVSRYAREALGLSETEANDCFLGDEENALALLNQWIDEG